MSTNEFDRLIRDKFDSGEFDYKPEGWQQLSRKMDLTPPGKTMATGAAGIGRWLPKAGIAAGIAAIIGISAYFMDHNTTAPHPQDTVTKTTTPTAVPTQAPVVTNTTAPATVPATTTNATTHVTVAAQSGNRPANATTRQQQTVPNTVVPQANNNNHVQVAQTNNNNPQQPQPAETRKPVTPLPKQPDFGENAYAADDKKQQRSGRTSFSLAGGVNYGSLNTGYTVGVSARRKLGDGRFYVEGDLAFVNSSAPKAASVSEAQYDALNTNYSGTNNTGSSGGNGPAAMAAVSAPVKTVSQEQALNSLYYLQFSPSVGYNVQKNIAVSVGADVQRLLQNNSNGETPVVLESDELKLIPQTDVGLTGKAEYGVTRRLKAGMLYREGVNALIDNKYINRRYVQVQVKFLLFGK
jgi:hypothetical protein